MLVCGLAIAEQVCQPGQGMADPMDRHRPTGAKEVLPGVKFGIERGCRTGVTQLNGDGRPDAHTAEPGRAIEKVEVAGRRSVQHLSRPQRITVDRFGMGEPRSACGNAPQSKVRRPKLGEQFGQSS
jgi:hypothetical protein